MANFEQVFEMINWNTVKWATTGSLPAYNTSTGSLTGSVNGAIPALDGGSMAVGEEVLVKNETGANAKNNGHYHLVQEGDGSNPWILKRVAGPDLGLFDAGHGRVVKWMVETGSVNARTEWSAEPTDNLGADPIGIEKHSGIKGPLPAVSLVDQVPVFADVYGNRLTASALEISLQGSGDDVVLRPFPGDQDLVLSSSDNLLLTGIDQIAGTTYGIQTWLAGNKMQFRLFSSGQTPANSGAISFFDTKQKGSENAGVNARDVFFFVSGSPNTKDSATTAGVALFGGDTVVSGNFYPRRNISSPDQTLTIEADSNLIQVAADSIKIIPGGSTDEVVFTRPGASSVRMANTAGAIDISASLNLDLRSGRDLQLTANDNLEVFSGDNMNFRLVSTNQTAAASSSFNFWDAKQEGDSIAAQGTDVMFFVSGVAGSKDGSTRGTALFVGDLHISGNLTVDGTSPGGGGGADSDWTDGGGKLRTTSSVAISSEVEFADAKGADVLFFVSGAVSSKDSATGQVSLIGGDLVTSGALYPLGGTITRPGGNLVISSSADTSLLAGDDVFIDSMGNTQIDCDELVMTSVGISSLTAEDWTVTLTDDYSIDVGGTVEFSLQSAAGTPPNSGSISFFDKKQGGVVTPATARDVFFFVSGSGGTKNSSTTAGVALFEGDVHMSGAVHFGEESPTISSSLIVENVADAPGFAGSNTGVVLRTPINGATLVTSASALLNIGSVSTQIVGGKIILVAPQNIDFILSSEGQLPGWTQPDERLRHFLFTDSIIGNDETPLAGTAHDVMFFVSGVVGGKDAASGSIALFGGDVHISGNLTVDGTSPGAGSGDVTGTDSSFVHQVPVFDATTGKSITTSSLYISDELGAGVAHMTASAGMVLRSPLLNLTSSSGFGLNLAANRTVGGLVSINAINHAFVLKESVGTDVSFYVSGTATRGAETDNVTLFNGAVVASASVTVAADASVGGEVSLGPSASISRETFPLVGQMHISPNGDTDRALNLIDNGSFFFVSSSAATTAYKNDGLLVMSGNAGAFPGGGCMLSSEGGNAGGIVSVNNISLQTGPLHTPGTDVSFFVSGTTTRTTAADRVTLYPGTVVVSGTLVAAPDSSEGTLDIASGIYDADMQTISGSATMYVHSEAEMFISAGVDGLGLKTPGVLSLQNITNDSPAFAIGNHGTDVSLFVSGTVASGSAGDKISVFNGSAVISGNLKVVGNIVAGSGLGGGGGGADKDGLTNTTVKTAPYLSSVGDRVLVNPQDGSTVAVSGAASPSANDLWSIKNITTSSHEFFIQGNGNSVEDPVTETITGSFALSGAALISLEYFYESTTSTWFLK
jgi:hypothetical protein